ncbi:MAG: hemolysin family protein [Candidatus Omnitrophica bacterium]|nr:hemolysin family protein [Candidatus Omnitrophota bacterium]MDD5652742.1 hemolysin family protein [Candidatus Omnitrophota bacterium]
MHNYNVFTQPSSLTVLIILILVSFLFSVSETSIISLSKIRLRNMISRKIKRAQSVQRLITKLDKFIVAILVGNNFVNIAISAIITGSCIFIFGYKWGIIIATVATALFIVIVCEITPKILAIKHTERIALAIAPFMEAFVKVFNPVIVVFMQASNLLIKLLGIKPAKKSPLITEEELRLMIEVGKEEGFLTDQEGSMLHRIFEFGDMQVGSLMVPKEKIVAVNINTSPDDLLNIFVEQGHARLPVYRGTIDNIVGIIYSHDLLYILKDKGLFLLQDLVHEASYVPHTMPVNKLLMKFQADKIQIAIVVNEQKKTVGLVTLEDLTEEIVGEVEEKHIKRHKPART